MTRRFLLITLVAAAPLPSLMASTYSAVLDRPRYDPTGGYYSANYFEASSVPAFTADFSADKTLEITYSAPAGYRFHIDAPPAAILAPLLIMDFRFPSTGLFYSQQAGTVTFGGASGDLPSMPAPEFALEPSGTIFSDGTITGSFAFSSVTLTIPVGAGFNADFLAVQPTIVRLTAEGVIRDSADPGPWASLEADPSPAPEPRGAGLFLSGLALIALGRRRKRRVQS